MVFVVNKHGSPLMPCSPCKARKLLCSGKARVLHKTPFTIKLIYGSAGYKQEIIAGLDTGSVTIGCAATANGKILYQSEVTLRNDITSKMQQRASFRRNRRGRKTRYRQARFDNRAASTKKGRLPPSIKSKIGSHLREIQFVESILPITQWKFELASFDIHKITNPSVNGKDYQNGPLKDFYNVKQYVLDRDNYKCQSGEKVKHSKSLHVHHIIFRSKGGSDIPSNLITLCETCHENLHNGKFVILKGKKSKTKHATEMGIIKSQLSKSNIAHIETFGYETKYKREQILKLPKTHSNDAIAICMEDGELVKPNDTIYIKKHISKGDYKLRKGSHSEIKIPVGKLFGLRKGDKVMTTRGLGFIKAKRSSGYFSVTDLDGNVIHNSEKVGNCKRITARSTTQVEEINLKKLLKRREKMQNLKSNQPNPVLSAVKDEVYQSNLG